MDVLIVIINTYKLGSAVVHSSNTCHSLPHSLNTDQRLYRVQNADRNCSALQIPPCKVATCDMDS